MTPLPAPQRVAAVVVAAGRGERLGQPEKVLLPLAGRAMLAWSLRALEHAETIGPVVVVAGSHTLEAVDQLVHDEGFAKVRAVVAGGERRQDSVGAGLVALPDGIEIVVIHDGARPLAEPELFDRCAAAAAERGAAIAAIPVADSLKRVAEGTITETVDRAGLWAAQTPQAFRLETLRRALAASSGETVTDEASLCEMVGVPVSVIPSSPANLKVTHREDIAVAEALLRGRRSALTPSRHPEGTRPSALGEGRTREVRLLPDPSSTEVDVHISASVRTGIGYDAHRFAAGRRLVLGGVEIPHDRGLDGHSDADVLLHAITDAVLGAAALGDIGLHFPPSDERFRDADSQQLLREVVRLVREAGWVPGNIDATVLAEAPRLAPHVALMRQRIAACLGLAPAAVSVKATTNEGMGSIGRGEGVAALATVTLVAAPGNPER
jgi:2-C-methyl-D-erythritol 4-phosphate cytidylyltransferase/2-C-methyl-D-erythritol 2,4-cyclodiphosphate synthase